ncbi:ECF transporter S component [Nesterenkonia aerolata]|uniref:ECF transporter S component n=1 Tax=Nesterenkonia aerolata TaxID=3074079 RepID=A0ABU2DRB4_9MICC|nr:ECF transporter S component [Nesterenkonia sp. LY-0111]MDR8019044.1 ECF transporter S component [Nesterenkonia sp. LY-0111]
MSTSAHRTTSPQTSPKTSPRRLRWSVSDIVVASTLAVACGVIFWGWNLSYHLVSNLFVAYPPAATLVHGMWLFPAVLGALIIRRPGAALYCEMVAAVVSALLGSQFGLTVLSSGFVQGLGAELIFLLFLYRRHTVDVAMLAGGLSGFFGGAVYHWVIPMYAFAPFETFVHIGCFALSGAVIAGLLTWWAVRGLARTSVLGPLASRHAHRESVTLLGARRR